jgi:glutamate dehydrogenase/leucine dehydrogenase
MGTPGVLQSMTEGGHELVLHAADASTGLEVIVAVHSTVLGPALGGTRFFPYPTERAALVDVLRLSSGMTLKAAAAGLDLGGGKAVILGDPDHIGSEALFEAYGRVVDSLGGRYITAEDVGTTVEDMAVVARRTRYVKGLPLDMGGSGDPSPMTARGVQVSMRAVAAHLWNSPSLAGSRIAVQGVGKVGGALVGLLTAEGADVLIADIDRDAVEEVADLTGAKIVPHDDILSTPCDVLAPCALGAVLSRTTIPELRCAAIVGSANNQLATREDAMRLAEAGILYAPDFVANAGGIVNISVELEGVGYTEERAAERVDRIFDRMSEILDVARAGAISPLAAAESLAIQRIATG